ncbi:hydroxyacid dehydrogenase [Ideonella sp. BN130291]|uniref:hydroxyacid dehydrogenase n=1 Tax=Ideonella sp. BN130291 TaxID=3112940 RepID=UPI002E253B12|nr:hydroxyacid dehydrogenase [Ideonella sp. BN130291]
MTACRIVITEFMDESAVQRLRQQHHVLYDPTLVDQPGALLAEAPMADALVVRNRTQVRGSLLAALQRCRVIGRLGVGLDNIDLPACEQRGMQVIPATGANAASVAEYTIASALLLLRGAYQASADVAAGLWPRAALSHGREVGGKVMGIVGFGDIGRLTARLAAGLGMQPVAWRGRREASDPLFAEAGVRALTLDELLAEADVVSLNLPLTPQTRGLFDATRIAAMKPGAVLVNTARGGIVDERALAAALREGRLGGAALDVFEAEPLPASAHFQGCPNLLLTPHVAGVTQEANQRVSGMIAEAVLRALG